MSGSPQRTIGSEVTLDGVGVHSGESANLTFRPAEPGTGIVFRRVDMDDAPEVPADVDHVVGTELGTTLGVGEARVLTVEHVLAAVSGVGVDNLVVEMDGPEVPIRDGSFREYTAALDEAGIVEQDKEARILTLHGVVEATGAAGDSKYVATPSDSYRISGTIDFEHPAIGRRYGSFLVDEESFRRELAGARTFGFKADADALHARGLALGASLDNAVVLDEDGVMNDELRYDDEYLRHKVGDVVGDLTLLGGRLRAHIVAERPSHSGNVELARAIRRHVQLCDEPVADTARIMQFLPHRYPMLLVDRIVDFVEGQRIVGIKNVTINEPFFQGHFPGHPVMPGVLIVEAMAQCGGLLLMDQVEEPESKVVYFMTMDKVKFRKPVTPGDTLVFELEVIQLKRQLCRMAGRGVVGGEVVAEAEFMARIMDK
ncbi:MAG: bifunctional UDP-3-O-[3-hydroxymyristoyl] N-acetylglucosamine deacetylase/3-hydroxyacyl-ACP dehydratase [Longimicrobiales bacterium]|nr:bifunctional UDP-3-O-[3-hydroxymyristoyl] N-acetylglucosamine deacetylase/3-hydroxyacyl-ACP dehydratase [Longimicrobiales bacterium]